MTPHSTASERRRYQALIGTGGVGAGLFFALEGDHTLGREESRSGRFLDRNDYCKLHIAAHYVQVLLGLLRDLDLIALNIDEAAAVAGILDDQAPAGVAEAAVHAVRTVQPQILVSVTAGRDGSWSWDGTCLTHCPAVVVEAVSTAGAGDAHLAGAARGLGNGFVSARINAVSSADGRPVRDQPAHDP